MGQRAAVIWLLLFICRILFSYFIFLLFFFLFHLGSDPRNCVSHIAVSKEIWCCNKGPRGNTLGKQHQLCPSSLFFFLHRKGKNRRRGKGEKRSPQCEETWSWGRLGFRKTGGVAASSCFSSQGDSASAQPQKYLTLQNWYFCDPSFSSLCFPCPHSWFVSLP